MAMDAQAGQAAADKAREETRRRLRQAGLTQKHRYKRLKELCDDINPNAACRALDMAFRLADEYPDERRQIGGSLQINFTLSSDSGSGLNLEDDGQ